jgi:hypothetical protein
MNPVYSKPGKAAPRPYREWSNASLTCPATTRPMRRPREPPGALRRPMAAPFSCLRLPGEKTLRYDPSRKKRYVIAVSQENVTLRPYLCNSAFAIDNHYCFSQANAYS